MTTLTVHAQFVLQAAQADQDIGQTIRDAAQQARDAAREAAQQARDQAQQAAQQGRDAQQTVREAEQQLREAQQEIRNAQQEVRQAHSGAERSAANDALRAAQQQVTDAERALREAQGMRTERFYTTTLPQFEQMVAPQVKEVAVGFFIMCAVIAVGRPLSKAIGRVIERRAGAVKLDGGMAEQLQRIEQSVEAMSIEVERISESQRYMVKLQDRAAAAPLGSGKS